MEWDTMLFADYNEGFGVRAVFGSRGMPGNELHIIVDSDDLASSVSFDVALGDVT